MRENFKKLTKNNFFWLLILTIILLPTSLPLIKEGFFHFSDESHIANLYEMIRAISSGQIPPRLAPDMSFGFGYPLFNFYYPLPYYFGFLVYLITDSLVSSIKVLFLITIFLSGYFMYFWLKNHTTKFGALIGAIIYVYAPYRALDLYVRGALGENFAFVFLPLIGLCIDKVVRRGGLKNVAILSLVSGLFILSHNLAPLVAIPLFFIYALSLLYSKKDFLKGMAEVLLGFILGFMISSYWSVPAFIEKTYLQKQTPFNYIDHFPFLKQLIYSKWGYGASVWGPNDDISFQIGLTNLTIVLVSILLFLFKKKEKEKTRLFFLFLTAFLFFIFLMNIRSKFLWEIFPLSDYIQFPWRLLMLTTLLTSFMVVFIKNLKLLSLIGILAIVLNVNYFKPSGYFYPDDDYYLNKFFANRNSKGETESVSPEYYNYSEDYILLPEWVKEKPRFLPKSKIESTEISIESLEQKSAINYSAELKAKTQGELTINFFYFPGWEVRLNKNKIQTKVLEPYGNFAVDLPAGNWNLEIFWHETTLRKFFDLVSLVSLLAIVLILVFPLSKKYEKA